jgi:hypothetical protein
MEFKRLYGRLLLHKWCGYIAVPFRYVCAKFYNREVVTLLRFQISIYENHVVWP